MTIGSNIKRLRRERDITQEQLADFLHLTPSAISQWETDRVLPDIQYLPKLAHLFKVSSDEILGINVEASDEEVNQIYKEVRELWCTARRSEAEKLCRVRMSPSSASGGTYSQSAPHRYPCRRQLSG